MAASRRRSGDITDFTSPFRNKSILTCLAVAWEGQQGGSSSPRVDGNTILFFNLADLWISAVTV